VLEYFPTTDLFIISNLMVRVVYHPRFYILSCKENYTLVLEMDVNWYSTVPTTVSGFINSSELRKMLGSIQGVPA